MSQVRELVRVRVLALAREPRKKDKIWRKRKRKVFSDIDIICWFFLTNRLFDDNRICRYKTKCALIRGSQAPRMEWQVHGNFHVTSIPEPVEISWPFLIPVCPWPNMTTDQRLFAENLCWWPWVYSGRCTDYSRDNAVCRMSEMLWNKE